MKITYSWRHNKQTKSINRLSMTDKTIKKRNDCKKNVINDVLKKLPSSWIEPAPPQWDAIFPPSHKQRFGLIHLPLLPQRFDEHIGFKHSPVEPLCCQPGQQDVRDLDVKWIRHHKFSRMTEIWITKSHVKEGYFGIFPTWPGQSFLFLLYCLN